MHIKGGAGRKLSTIPQASPTLRSHSLASPTQTAVHLSGHFPIQSLSCASCLWFCTLRSNILPLQLSLSSPGSLRLHSLDLKVWLDSATLQQLCRTPAASQEGLLGNNLRTLPLCRHSDATWRQSGPSELSEPCSLSNPLVALCVQQSVDLYICVHRDINKVWCVMCDLRANISHSDWNKRNCLPIGKSGLLGKYQRTKSM